MERGFWTGLETGFGEREKEGKRREWAADWPELAFLS